jgi:hypothetical protein
MLSVYPFASGSLYTASYALSASFATSASFIQYVLSASSASTVLFPQSGSRGKSVCLITTEQYDTLIATSGSEVCNIPT